jgi:Ca2+-binding EF-hand superfamily protein
MLRGHLENSVDLNHTETNTTHSTDHHGCEEHNIYSYLDHLVVLPVSLPAAESGFSSGLALSPLSLIVAYAIVAIFAVILDIFTEYLEDHFKGSHKVIIQRIYRTIMVLGCSTVCMKIFVASGVNLSHEWTLAYEFADMTSFMTALFFACQGFIIMVISIADANAWYRAGSIRVEELLIDVEAVQRTQPHLWQWVWLPFCRTRDEVEFRLLRLIFSSTYHITADPHVFNYAELLKRTHECNLLELIDFDYWKWTIIVFIIGIVSLKSEFGYSHTCSTQACVALDELLFFTSGGFLLVISALLLALAGRRSELKLLRRYGIFEPQDYEIYLRKEEDILEKMSEHVLSKKALMTLIADLKHDVAVRQFKKQHKLLTPMDREHDSDDMGTGGGGMGGRGMRRVSKMISPYKSSDQVTDFEEKAGGLSSARGDHRVEGDVERTVKRIFGGGGGGGTPMSHGGQGDRDRGRQSGASEGEGGGGGSRHNSLAAVTNIASTLLGKFHSRHSAAAVGIAPPTPSQFEMMEGDSRTNPQNKLSIFEVVPDDVAQRHFRGGLLRSIDYDAPTLLSKPTQGKYQRQGSEVSSRRVGYGRQSSQEATSVRGPVNNTVGLEEKMKDIDDHGRIRVTPKLSPEEEKKKRHEAAKEKLLVEIAKKKLQHAYHGGEVHDSSPASSSSSSIMFKDIFLFGDPIYYRAFISWLMTGNALYLAWWLTTFTFAATKLSNVGDIFFWFVFPLVPAILAFPLLAIVIKSSTTLKAITEIDLEVVSEVMEGTEEIRKYVNLLRKSLLHRLHLTHPGGMENERQERKAVSDLFEEVEDSHTGTMSLEDFRRMLVRLQMFLDKPVWMGMYAWIDLNHNGYITLEVLS